MLTSLIADLLISQAVDRWMSVPMRMPKAHLERDLIRKTES